MQMKSLTFKVRNAASADDLRVGDAKFCGIFYVLICGLVLIVFCEKERKIHVTI